MDDILLTLNHISSFALIMFCWWLTHAYASDGKPYGRTIGALWALIGFSVAITAVSRNLSFDPNGFIILTKCLMVALCAFIARRLAVNTRKAARDRSRVLKPRQSLTRSPR